MMSFHISHAAREKVLKEIASRARKQVLATWSNVLVYFHRQGYSNTLSATSVAVMPDIKQHVDRLLERIRKPRMSKPMLLPVKAVAAPKATVEVQPFLVICPADIVTIVKALFPEPRSRFPGARDIPGSGLISSASSISGVSTQYGFSTTPRDSILSQSFSSVNSAFSQSTLDGTFGFQDNFEALTQEEREAALIHPVPTEEYGRKLRNTLAEMKRVLGSEAMSGSCHPCADRWAVLHISKDGKELLTRMRKDSEDEDQDEESFDSDSDAQSNSNGVADIDYHQLKEAVVRLLSEFELPKQLTDQRTFSNNGKSSRKSRAAAQPRNTTPTPADDSRQTGQLTGLISVQRAQARNQ
jgi:hypothetical protein